MSEEPATLKQIKKLYAVVRNSGRDPSEYVRELKEERKAEKLTRISKREMSKLIDQFEQSENGKKEVAETSEVDEEEKKEVPEVVVPEAVEKDLNEIDAVFDRCLVKARNTVRKYAKSMTEPETAILEIAGLYLKIYHDEKGGKERE